MFYSVFVLGKKGPLARVWLAAHWDKKITKAQILETNIVESVDSILQPKIKLSLRTSSHLLLGIVRIYSRKALYLLQDCQDAAFKIKSAFRPGVVDLPDGKTEAAISAITLPETFDFINDFDLMAEPQLHMEPATTAVNIRNITLVEDISSINVDDPLMMHDGREWSEIGSIGTGSINIKDNTSLDHNLNDSGVSLKNNFDLFDRPALDDGFGGQLGVGIVDDVDADDVFNMPMPEKMGTENGVENGVPVEDKNGDGGEDLMSAARPSSALSDASADSFGAPASFGPSSPDSTLADVDPFVSDNVNLDNQLNLPDDEDMGAAPGGPNADAGGAAADAQISTQNTMVLEPIDPQVGLTDRKRKRRKKIGMVIDEVKTLSGEEMKAQLSDTSDIVTNLDLAPPNKMLMNWKKTGLSDKLFTLPERSISAKVLFQYYSKNLITNRIEGSHQEDDLVDDQNDLANQLYSETERPVNGMLDPSLDPALPPLDEMDKFQHTQLEEEDEEVGVGASQNTRAAATRNSYKNLQSPAPHRQKRKKTEDKENKDVANKRPRESKYNSDNGSIKTPALANHTMERTQSTMGNDASNLIHDSSIPEFRDHTETHGSISADHLNNKNLDPNFLVNDQSEEEREEEEEDDIFDYAGPMSVGPAEEMLPDETIDQYEERIRTKRYNLLLKYMAVQLEDNGHIQFSNLARNNKRKMVAQKFYGLLVLKKQMAIELYQNREIPYSELIITKGQKYEEHMVSTTVS